MKGRTLDCAWLAIGILWSAAGSADGTVAVTIRADVWADNWFALYVDNALVKEDSVPYNTERSFNAESFVFDVALPAQLSVVMKDFKEDDSGLEYIGTSRQQVGDGGFSAQFFDASDNRLVAATDSDWRCITIHRAPINKECARSSQPGQNCSSEIDPEPTNWKSADFDDSDWPAAVVHSAQAVRPRGGYDQVTWQPEAKLIWTTDLEIDNTVLCRYQLPAPD